MAVAPSGKFVYVVNQNGNTVSIYSATGSGTLTAAGTVVTGSTPFSIALTGGAQ
jgi:6-phosphogluconolactonase (cycloisomerase 2 family)